MKSAVELVTPELAAKWLSSNTHNRPVKSVVVSRLAGAIVRGEWCLNGEAIKFGASGVLLDGQHRLMAIVETGIAIKTLVVRDIPGNAQETMDIGNRRSTADILKLRGETNYSELAAGLTQLFNWRHSQEFGRSLGGNTPTPQQLVSLLDAEPNIRKSMPQAQHWRRFRYPSGIAIAIHYILAAIDSSDADYFFERVGDGQGLVRDDALLTLREALFRDTQQPRPMLPIRRAAITIRAWNAFRDGEKITKLQWSPGGSRPDTFPTPH